MAKMQECPMCVRSLIVELALVVALLSVLNNAPTAHPNGH